MKGIQEFVILILWVIAIVATFLIIKDTGKFSYLAPVYSICMIGSIITVRTLKKGNE